MLEWRSAVEASRRHPSARTPATFVIQKNFPPSKNSLKSRQNFPMTCPAASFRPEFMKRPVNLGVASLKAVAVVVVLDVVAHAGLPYLPLIGPPPLRMLALAAPRTAGVKLEASPVAKIETPATIATNLPAVVETKVFPGVTSVTGGDTSAVVSPLINTSANQSLEDTLHGSVFALPTPDLLGITPQMLATYFHPVQFGTNAVMLSGPYPISFQPPLPPPPTDKSSRAEYIIK